MEIPKQGVVEVILTEHKKLSAEELLNREIKLYEEVIEDLEKSSKPNKIELISQCHAGIEHLNREYLISNLEKQIKMVESSSNVNKLDVIVHLRRAIELMGESIMTGTTIAMDSPIIEPPQKRLKSPTIESPMMEHSPMESPLMERWPGKRPLRSIMESPSMKSSTSEDVNSDDEKPNAK
jgi:hypothetical protein